MTMLKRLQSSALPFVHIGGAVVAIFAALALVAMIAALLTAVAAPAAAQEAGGSSPAWQPALSEALLVAALTLAAPVAALLVRLLAIVASRMGFDLDERRRARLQEIVENGIRGAASRRGLTLQTSPLDVGVREKIVSEATEHVADTGAETIRKLGGRPDDLEATALIVEARGARLLAPGRSDLESTAA